MLARQRLWLRRRYTVLVAAILIPAIASAAQWPPEQQLEPRQASATLHTEPATFNPDEFAPAVHSDADSSLFATDGLTGPAARPFFAAGSALDQARAEQCLTMAVYYEAATESDDGQRAVAQVVLNRVAHPSYPNTVCGVVFQGSERSTGCQFSFTCDGSLARRPAAFWWDRARRVAHAALTGTVYAPVGLATHYHTLQVHPSWSDSLVAVMTIGAHRFFRWPGAAGQRAAFSVAYQGGEPAAMPHPRALTPAFDSDPDPIALARAYEATVAHIVPLRAQDRPAAPAYSAAVEARGGDALFRADSLPAGGGLSPEFERSGQWLQRP